MTSATTRCSSPTGRRDDLLDATPFDVRGFCATYTEAVDAWVSALLDDVPGVALVAVGGYGRAELCPFSDLDLVLVHDRRDVERLAEAIWYPIWDSGVRLDHSVRTPQEVEAAARADPKVALGWLDARVVAGDAQLATDAIARAARVWHEPGRALVRRLRDECDERHARAGDVAYLLEPDVKEARGGLRDVTVVRALLAIAGARASPAFDRAAATLLLTRVALQRRVRRAEDRLLLELQDDAAGDLGASDADALMARVAACGRVVSAVADDAWHRVRPRSRRHPRRAAGPGLVVAHGEVHLTADADPAGDPSLLVRAAVAAARHRVRLAPAASARLAEHAPVLPVPWSDDVRDAFVALLLEGDAAVPVVEALDHQGLWTRVLPEWDAVRSLPQRNAFHRYTVDRHLLEAVARAVPLTARVGRPDLLVVGALLHDLGKGFPGDHTDVGTEVAAIVAARMGFDARDVETLVATVRHHLLLPAVATSRDLDEAATIDAVADAVESVELLALLHALTEADSLATGDTAWGAWKAELVATLAVRVRDRLTGDVPLDVEAPVDVPVGIDVTSGRVRVRARDRPALFADVVGVLTLHGYAVRAARAGSATDGTAWSVFDVVSDRAAARNHAVQADLDAALAGRIAVAARVEERAATPTFLRRPTAARRAETRVTFDNDGSQHATILEIRTADGPGVLHRIARALAALELDIRHAKVSTLGHEVIDTFYVVSVDGGKVVDESRLGGIRDALVTTLARPRAPSASSDSRQRMDENA